MKHHHTLLTTLVALLITVPAIAQNTAQSDKSANRTSQVSVRALVSNWLAMDKDDNGKVSKAEAEGRLKTSFDRNDANKDGYLTRSELEALAKRRLGGRNQPANADRNEIAKVGSETPPMSTKDLLKLTPDGVMVVADIA
ncbi:MAG: EF-hand domain-containing protein [Fuerstiella sp.]|nr:hypothetical protein [Fuerstiella sp.]